KGSHETTFVMSSRAKETRAGAHPRAAFARWGGGFLACASLIRMLFVMIGLPLPLRGIGMLRKPMLTTAEPEFPLHSSVLYSQVALRARFVGEFERSGWKRFSTGIIGPRIPCRTRPRADGRTRLSRKREVHARLADAIGKHGRRRALHLQRKALTTE